jgi:hypothetical protein
MCRDNIYLRQEDVKNINSSLNRCLEEGRHILTLNDFAALSQSKTIIEKMKKLETESIDEYRQQGHLIDSIPFRISSQTLREIISTSGVVGAPRESLYRFKYIASKSTFFYSYTIICSTEM